MKEKIFSVYKELIEPTFDELMCEIEKQTCLKTGETIIIRHGSDFVSCFNDFIVVKSSRNRKIYVLDAKNKKKINSFLTFCNLVKDVGLNNLTFDFKKNAIVSTERNKFYLINESLEKISNEYKNIKTILDLNNHLLAKTDENHYVLIDINGQEKSVKFKDLMEEHEKNLHWFLGTNDLYGIMEIKNETKVIEDPKYKSFKKNFGCKFECVDEGENIVFI